jgi:hypothetical protein
VSAGLAKGNAAEGFAQRIVRWAGAYLISFVGLLHLLEAGEHFDYAAYLGALFLANFAASAVAALGIVWMGARWAWLLGVAVAGGAFVALLWSRTFGLPGFPDGVGQWFNFLAWMAVAFELPFLALAPLALTPRGRALVAAEQRRVDREELPPTRQETPEHFALLEGEMREIRARMATDVRDLRAHLDPKALVKRANRGARKRLRALLLPGRDDSQRP